MKVKKQKKIIQTNNNSIRKDPMYTLSSKLRLFSIILMVVGLLGIVIGFITTPSTKEEVIEMLASEEHGAAHGNDYDQSNTDPFSDGEIQRRAESERVELEEEGHGAVPVEAVATSDLHPDEHVEHVLHQLQNKPWAAIYVSALFFFMIALGVLVFYALQYVSQAGWSPVLFRVMEGITAYVLPGGIIVFILLVLSALHFNHLFVWMDPAVVAEDEIIQGKTGFLNIPFFLIRAAIFIAGWCLYRHFSRKYSARQDEATDNKWFKKTFKISAGFLVFFIVTESIASWDWIMSLDPHWYSTLFGWYVFASMFVSGVTMIAIVTVYLKSKGYLDFVNNSHIHDLAKFMFGLSIFWTYLWFSQFLLIWYSNIPEEVVYFITRIEDYNILFFGMVVLNFLFPVLLLMNSDYKRINWFVVATGIIILVGHYLDVYNMVMPATVGSSWSFGWAELGAILFFSGLFVFVVFNSLTKAPLLVKRNPFIKESTHFHY